MYRTIENRSRLFIILCTALAFLSMFFLSSKDAKAKGLNNPIKVDQIIRINREYSKPKDTFTYILEPITKDAPLPKGAVGSYEFELVGEEEKYLDIQYKKVGYYTYKLYQKKNLDKKYVSQDDTEYTLKVKVAKKGQDLEAKVYMMIDSDNHKVTELEFINSYNIPQYIDGNKTIINPQTGDNMRINLYLILIISSFIISIYLYIKDEKNTIIKD